MANNFIFGDNAMMGTGNLDCLDHPTWHPNISDSQHQRRESGPTLSQSSHYVPHIFFCYNSLWCSQFAGLYRFTWDDGHALRIPHADAFTSICPRSMDFGGGERKALATRGTHSCQGMLRSEFVMSTENARDSGQSSTNTSNTQQHSQQLRSRVAGIIHFNS